MASTDSLSKGVFVFSNGFKLKNGRKKSRQKLFEFFYKKDVWYTTYKRNWNLIEHELKELHLKTYSKLLSDIVAYLKGLYDIERSTLNSVIPSASLLTGVSQPDHVSQFTSLIDMIRKEVTSHIALIHLQDASSVKNIVENTVWQLINGYDALENSFEEQDKPKLKRNQCTMKTLKNWYLSKYSCMSPKKKKRTVSSRLLVIIIPEFESFNCNVLQDYIMILSSYVPDLPIVLIFGVATSVSALHQSLPYHVSSKLMIEVFHTHTSPVYMNQVLEEIFLTHTSPFHLSGKVLELLTDVFLFYDFSVTGLIQNMKYCMMEHYYGDNIKSLCCTSDKLEEAVLNLSSEELNTIRQLQSFRPYLEKQECKTKIKLFEDDNFFRKMLLKEIHRLHSYLYTLYMCVRLLCVFIKDMPKNVIGKTVREIYTKCAVENITNTPAFKESMQLLGFQSQVKLVESIKSALRELNSYLQLDSPTKVLRSTPTKNNSIMRLSNDLGEDFAKTTRVHLLTFLRQIENANTDTTVFMRNTKSNEDEENTPENRYKLKEKLLKATKVDKIESEFEMVRSRFVSYLHVMFSKGLQPPREQTFHEIVFFGDVSSVRKQIVGSPRGAIHTALSNPVHYLQCSCCVLPSPEVILGTLPDVSIAYKFHRECGTHINLYDWLQAFATIVCPDNYETAHQDKTIQLRFKRAVAELQFLGFIKLSKRKTDHVMRLTW